MRIAPNLTTLPLTDLRAYYALQKRHCEDMIEFLDGNIAETLKQKGATAVFKGSIETKKKRGGKTKVISGTKKHQPWKLSQVKEVINVMLDANLTTWEDVKNDNKTVRRFMKKYDRTEKSIHRKMKLITNILEEKPLTKVDDILEEYKSHNKIIHAHLTKASLQAKKKKDAEKRNSKKTAEPSVPAATPTPAAAATPKPDAAAPKKSQELNENAEEAPKKENPSQQLSSDLLYESSFQSQDIMEAEADDLLNNLDDSQEKKKRKKKKKKKRKRKKDEEDPNERPSKKTKKNE